MHNFKSKQKWRFLPPKKITIIIILISHQDGHQWQNHWQSRHKYKKSKSFFVLEKVLHFHSKDHLWNFGTSLILSFSNTSKIRQIFVSWFKFKDIIIFHFIWQSPLTKNHNFLMPYSSKLKFQSWPVMSFWIQISYWRFKFGVFEQSGREKCRCHC